MTTKAMPDVSPEMVEAALEAEFLDSEMRDHTLYGMLDNEGLSPREILHAAFVAVQAALAAQPSETVGWMYEAYVIAADGWVKAMSHEKPKSSERVRNIRPLYTSPNTSHLGDREAASWLRNMPTDDKQAFNREVAGVFGHNGKVPGGTKVIVDCVLPYLADAIERLITPSTTPEPNTQDAGLVEPLEQRAERWLEKYSASRFGEHPNDVSGFDADNMIDAFLDGFATALKAQEGQGRG